uniref:Uncharacterized protein n=1 Tax=Micrurus corallinus TaxID=54390 RepID=A0A2D4F4G6_MICCO
MCLVNNYINRTFQTSNSPANSSPVPSKNYSMCSEPGGKYLYHFCPEKGSKIGKPAQVIVDNLVCFMKKKSIDKSLKAIGGHSTKVNTGYEGVAMHWVEVKPEHPLAGAD